MAYGMFVIHCKECGWKTAKRKGDKEPPTKCEACDKDGVAELCTEVAAMVFTITELRSRRVQDIAEKSSLRIYQISKNHWVVLDVDCPNTVKYGDKAGRAYLSMKAVCGPANWQTVMLYLRKHTQDVPAYLLH